MKINRKITTKSRVLNAINKAGFRLIRTETGATELISKDVKCLPGEIIINKIK